ncbi:MAG: hypothetical protein JXQ72_14595 [Anaerolineae bacterium]|nr:hypothetical protein [Anaerolineae bacterium]
MDSAPEFLDLFVEPTGELIYFLVVIAISQAALLMALGQRARGPSEVAAGRYTVLLTLTVLTWIMMGVGELVALATDTPDNTILPPLERAVNLEVILLTGAALLVADSARPSERGSWRVLGLLSLGILAAYFYTAQKWQPLADTESFNQHNLGFVWTFVPGLALILLIGLLLTRYKHSADIPLKLIYFIVLLIGYTYTTILISGDNLEGHTSGALRLAFLTTLPVIAIVVYRLVIDRLNAAIDEVSEYAEAVSRPQPPAPEPQTAFRPASRTFGATSESMTLLKAVGLMLEGDDPEHIPRQITTAIAGVLKADVAVLLAHEDSRWADVVAAYDHIQQRLIPGLALNLEEQPTVAYAIEHKMQRVLYPDRNMDELVDLYTRLDIGQVGPAYIQPLTREGIVIGIAIIGLPYTQRELLDNETSLLEGLGPIAARLLAFSRAAARLRFSAEDRAIQAIVESEGKNGLDQTSLVSVRQEMQASLELAQQQIAELSRMVRDLQVELDYERSRVAQLVDDSDDVMTISQRIDALSHERATLAAERELLSQALQEAQATLISATAEGDGDVYTSMIESLRRERDELEVQKSKLERQLDDIRQAREQAVPSALREMLDDLSGEKARLAAERDSLKTELGSVQEQLKGLGIEGGPLAVAQALGQITEERTYYKTRAEKIAQERDLLLEERKTLQDRIQRETEREAKLAALESDLRRLATDREALTKQRDTARAERDQLLKAREGWLKQRARLMGEVTALQDELEGVTFSLNQSSADRDRLSTTRSTLEAERDRLLAELTASRTERDQLMARAEGNRELLEQLGADGVGTLKDMIEDLTNERQRLEAELLQAQQDLVLREREHARPASSATQETRAIAPENADVIMSIAQELRTPMSSIMGYTDLLLGESVGILGALQRQFIQRVQANIQRLTTLVTDLISISVLDSDDFKLEPITIDPLAVIEDAITGAGAQFREKNITLHMNLDNSLPHLRADRDALLQVITQLLSNAYLASPPDSEISIAAHHVRDFVPPLSDDIAPVAEPLTGVKVSVTDQGGGIPPEEQRRVFGRLYRADNPLIEGIGDTGVGLSIAKALVEAHRGTIWLESDPGQGSTFHFVIPIRPHQSQSHPQEG